MEKWMLFQPYLVGLRLRLKISGVENPGIGIAVGLCRRAASPPFAPQSHNPSSTVANPPSSRPNTQQKN
jgi:hypothetical protein